MTIFRQRRELMRELGFGSKSYQNAVRFFNKDGTVNVKRTGLGFWENVDIYHWLIAVPRWKLFSFIIVGYITVNFLFAGLYFCIGPENFGGIDQSGAFNQFINLFFFSSQTITTLGYGHVYPKSNAAGVATAIESLLGLLSFAITTGVLFGRFSRPKADLLYSKNILIAPYQEITGLMFRVTNKKQYELIESEVSVAMTMKNPETNTRDFLNLNLEISKINYLALCWTIVHPIDESSPLYQLSLKDLEERDMEILILIKAINDTISQSVYSRFSYKAGDFVMDAKFKPLPQEATRNGKLKVAVNEIHLFDLLKKV
jgi:inward rectifier potassium channel